MSRTCARPGCSAPAEATLSYAYHHRQVWLDQLAEQDSPANHDLCRAHADRTKPPKGWELVDRRLPDSGFGFRAAC